MTTEDKILAKALDMFNKNGVEYVGLRELAALLDMRVSNITYYFPTKDDLVFRLTKDLGRENSGIIFADKDITLESYFGSLKKLLNNQARYRCLFLSFVNLQANNKKIAERYKITEKIRYQAHRANLNNLAQSGFLSVTEETVLDFLTSSLAIILRFWISEATISFKNLTAEQQIHYYIRHIAQLFMPYATKKGTLYLKGILEE